MAIEHVPQRRAYFLVSSLIGLLVLGGCASVPAPIEQMALSRAAVADAVSAEAPEYAASEMRSAQQKLDQASAAMRSGDYVIARRLAEQSEADARLAGAKARSEKAQRTVLELRESIRALQEEMNRQAP